VIDIVPKYLVVPPDQETVAQKALTAIQATQTTNANPFSFLTLIVEPRLTNTTRWYLFGDPARNDTFVYSYLSGAEGPQIETQAGFYRNGVETRVSEDFGCGWLDYRNVYANPGA
jgi:hypothetical protein